MDLYLCLDKLVNFKPVVSPAPEDGSPRPGQKDKEETERTGISPAGSQDWDGPSKQSHKAIPPSRCAHVQNYIISAMLQQQLITVLTLWQMGPAE